MNSTGHISGWRRRAVNPLAASLVLALLAGVVFVVPGANEALQWRRGVCRYEPWRLLTGHLTHFTSEHLLFDVLGLVLLSGLACRAGLGRFTAALLGAALAIPLAIGLARPELDLYRGLSGLDAALFALVVVDRLRAAAARHDTGRLIALTLVAVAGVGKVLYELAAAQVIFVDTAAGGFVPVPLAHAVGAAMGLAAATWNNGTPVVSHRQAALRFPRWLFNSCDFPFP